MSNKKQTAVEWLINYIETQNKNGYEFHPKYNEEIINQAKELEKQQIVNTYLYGKYESDLVVMSDKYYAEQYYNETFNT